MWSGSCIQLAEVFQSLNPLGFELEAWPFYILQKAYKEGAIGHTG
jgi:hypothetical protein